jgi:membrane-anchored protein YejM (alkaline phosphatase superfamily)
MTNPHEPSWNASITGLKPPDMAERMPFTPFIEARQDIGFRNRSSSALDLDDLIGTVLDGIDKLDAADNTWVIFTR